MEFVALLSSGKGTWGQVAGLVNKGEWEKKIFVIDRNIKSLFEKFDFGKNAEVVEVDMKKEIKKLIEELKEKLKEKLNGPEIALTIASGTGKEHMALISALLRIPVGIRFVVLTKDGIVEF